VMDRCRDVVPPLRELKPRHFAACHLYEESNGEFKNLLDGKVIRAPAAT
jgi:hypothetical protein